MVNWYDMPGALIDIESHPAFLEKVAIDDVKQEFPRAMRKTRSKRMNAWVSKRNHKKKLIRRFLSVNPDMDYSKLCGTS